MQEQILDEKKESAIEIVPSKQAIKELLADLKALKNRKDDLLLPFQNELEEIENKDMQIRNEITMLMQDLQETVFTDDGKAVWKLMPKPSLRYNSKALDAIREKDIRELLDSCKKLTKQGEPKTLIEIY